MFTVYVSFVILKWSASIQPNSKMSAVAEHFKILPFRRRQKQRKSYIVLPYLNTWGSMGLSRRQMAASEGMISAKARHVKVARNTLPLYVLWIKKYQYLPNRNKSRRDLKNAF